MKPKAVNLTLEKQLAGLYDGPVSDAEAAEMAMRLCGFADLLLEIEREAQADAG